MDIVREKNAFLNASTGTEVKESLINLLTAINNSWVISCLEINNVMNGYKNNDILASLTILRRMKRVGVTAFWNCSFLTTLQLDSALVVDGMAFYSCPNLRSLSLPHVERIDEMAFKGCSMFSSLTIGNEVDVPYSVICSLSSSNAFEGTAFENGVGSIFVRADLVDEYISAPNWSYFSDLIVPIDAYAGGEDDIEEA